MFTLNNKDIFIVYGIFAYIYGIFIVNFEHVSHLVLVFLT